MTSTDPPSPVPEPPPVAPDEVDEAPAAGAEEAGLVPPVVVALVAHVPGDWFEEALAAFAAQDYPNLSVLVIDAGSTTDVLSRVADVLPSAYVRRVEGNPGFSAAANEVLEVVEGAAFYCFCHDDVAPAPSAIRILVEEALRSNAAVVGPKLVDWDDPARLLEVGFTADKTGVLVPFVYPGEIDQEQHDAIRDVFAVPSACVLVRADLFRAIDGFDRDIEYEGEDLDLCWRAQVAGARVVVVPDARVRHRSRLAERREDEHERTRLKARHRLRTVLVCYGRFHLARVLPQTIAVALGEIAVAIASGRPRLANDIASAWSWNLGRLSDIRERRRALREVRRFPDSEVRRLQAHGSARLNAFVRGELGQAEQLRESIVGVGRGISNVLTSAPRRLVLAAWLLVAVVVLIGSRDLIAGRVPDVAGFAPIERGPFAMLRAYLSGWHAAGLGAETPVPTAVGLLGLAQIPLFGARGTLQMLLTVGMLPIGAIGAWRLMKPLASHRARAVGLALYVANPLPYDALGRGVWGGVLFYGAAPWLIARLFRDVGDDPFARAPDRRRPLAAYGVLLALLAALVPVAGLVLIAVALALVLASAIVGGGRGAIVAVRTAALGVLVAAALHFPWTLDFVLPGADWWAVGGVSPLGEERVSVGDLLRFHVGSVGVPVLATGIVVAAALALLIGQDWRFRWAVRCWTIAVVCGALAWTGSNGMLPLDAPSVHVVLVPAALALALSAGLGVLSFEVDLRGYRFGVRQGASFVAAVFGVAAVVPVLVASLDGRWESPRVDLGRTLSFLDGNQIEGGFRTLWIGDPEVLPLASFRYGHDLAYALSDNGLPEVADRIATSPSSATELVADAIRLVADGRTDRFGRLLAPFGVRYVALVSSAAPTRAYAIDRPLPDGLAETVGRQLDLRDVDVDPAVQLFESTAWMPVRALLRGAGVDAVERGQLFSTAAQTDFSGAVAAEGRIDPGIVHLATPAASGWHLEVDGEDVERGKSLGWANRFTVTRAGVVDVDYETSPTRYLALIAQLVLWIVVVRAAFRRPVVPPAEVPA